MPSSSEGYSEGDSVWSCDDCNVTCNSEQCYEAHLKGKRHLQNVGKHADRATASSGTKWSCDTCSVTCNSERSLQDHLRGKNHAFMVKNKPSKEPTIPASGEWSCNLCEVVCNCKRSYEEHKAGKMHARHERRARDRSLSKSTCGNEEWYCGVCVTSCSSKLQYDGHLQGAFHAARTRAAADAAGNGSQFRCEACEVVCGSERHFREHESGRRHARLMSLRVRVEQMGGGDDRGSVSRHCHICDCDIADQKAFMGHLKGGWYRCDVCNVDSFNGVVPYYEHILSPTHKRAAEVLKSFHSKNDYACDVCKVPQISGFAQYLDHLQSGTHDNTVNAYVRVTTHCDFCNSSCSGVVPFVDHLDSAAHKKKVAEYKKWKKI